MYRFCMIKYRVKLQSAISANGGAEQRDGTINRRTMMIIITSQYGNGNERYQHSDAECVVIRCPETWATGLCSCRGIRTEIKWSGTRVLIPRRRARTLRARDVIATLDRHRGSGIIKHIILFIQSSFSDLLYRYLLQR